ncbi:MAG: metallophosphoesterase [Acidobacteriota bacterium]
MKTKFLMFITALALLTPEGLRGTPATAPAEPISFAVIGDFGYFDSKNDYAMEVANMVKSWNPGFIITTGDNSYLKGLTKNFHNNIGRLYHEYIKLKPEFYKPEYGAQPAENKFYPTMGNHDWDGDGGKPYSEYFSALPVNEYGHQRYYDFIKGPVHFFALSSDPRERDTRQGDWFKRRIAASTSRWKIVYFHHPPYTSRTGHGPTESMRWDFLGAKVTAVLTGHNHNYEQLRIDCLPYFVVGSSGRQKLYAFSDQRIAEGSVSRYDENYGAMKVTASDERVVFEFFTRAGVSIDRYEVTTSRERPPLPPANLSVRRVSGSRVDVKWQASSCDEAGFVLEQSTDGRTFSEVARLDYNARSHSVTGLDPATEYFYRVRAFNNAGESGYSNIDSFNPAFSPNTQFRAPARGRARTRRRAARVRR